ncbi:MAG TPA: UDP-N-acetylmuramoyl-L-alanyl-D-glutamate--2,6-diaminopimelate ligase [Pirellulales bacterium]|nr:UDP-N-acetylmuramoyl-L-alanyl-D-glutamate--2,6-diaminopimelate ligase [Pirellulales bacterium]
MTNRAAPLRGISLQQVLPEAELIGADELCVTSCCADSRVCRPGDLFVAISGASVDGYAHICEAIERGASAVLADRPLPAECQAPACYVADVREAYGKVCQALAGHPGRRMRVIGITGTNGKTTTSYLTASVLAAGGYRTGILGTLGFFDGDEFETADWTTPPAPVLATWLARMAANGCTHAVMEVSSHAMSQSRVAGLDFDVACFTNVRRDHLDYHGTTHKYRAAKARLLEHLLPEGFAVINADDPVAAGLLAKVDGPVLSIGIENAAEVAGQPLEQFASEQTFLLSVENETVPVRTPLIGRHNIYNCLSAAAVGLAYGIDLATIVRGLESIRNIPGRLERLECGQPFSVFVDYAHTPDALTACLDSLRKVTSGRLICVFGAGGDRDALKRPLMGRAVEAGADLAVLTNDNPRSEPPQRILGQILDGFRRTSEAWVIADRGQAIRWALSQARVGDCVLIAGKGHEQFQIIGNEQFEFDDRQVARQWLYESPAIDELYRASA